MNIRLMSALALFASAGAALGQLAPPAPSQPAKPNPMTGPRVTPKAGEPTLIKYDSSGKLVRPDASPDEAALELVGLDAGEKEAVKQLIAGREAILDGLVSENLPLLLKFLGVRLGDNPKEQMQALKDLTKVFEPVREMGSLRDQVVAVISKDKADKYTEILQEYWAAVTQEDEQNLTAKGKPMTPGQIRGYETMLAFGSEVRRSYDRQIEAKTGQLNNLLVKINATPAQDAKIHALANDFSQKTQGKPTAQQGRELFQAILKDLDDSQKMALLKELYAAKK